jgi:hypothetical protein
MAGKREVQKWRENERNNEHDKNNTIFSTEHLLPYAWVNV